MVLKENNNKYQGRGLVATEKRDKYHQLGELVVKVRGMFSSYPSIEGMRIKGSGIRRYLNRMVKHQPHEPSYTPRNFKIASEKRWLENYFSLGFRYLFRGEIPVKAGRKPYEEHEKIISHLNWLFGRKI